MTEKHYVDRHYDLPDWLAANLLIHYEKVDRQLQAGKIAIEWWHEDLPKGGTRPVFQVVPRKEGGDRPS